MTAMAIGLLVVLFCPVALSIVVWMVALNGSMKRDEISEVVAALTGPNDIAKRKAGR